MPVSWSTAFKLYVGAWLSGMATPDALNMVLHRHSNHFFHDALGRQFGGQQNDRHTGTRVRGCSRKVQVLVLRMPVLRSKVTHLHEIMTQAEGGALLQVEALFPDLWLVDDLELDVFLQVVDSHVFSQPPEHGLACTPHPRVPVLLMRVVQMADGH